MIWMTLLRTCLVLCLCGLLGGLNTLCAQNYSIVSHSKSDGEYVSTGFYPTDIPINGQLSAAQTLPFSFDFYGQPVSNYRISEYGYIVFDASSGSAVSANTSIPNSGGPNNAIYALWDDFASGAAVTTTTFGMAPNRVHRITWSNLTYVGAGQERLTVSLHLFESCHDFEVVIKKNDMTSSSTSYNQHTTTIGCENATGSLGVQVSGSPNYRPASPITAMFDAEVHRFCYGAAVTNDASLVNISIKNHLTTGNHTLYGHVRNEGSTLMQSYTVNYSLNGGPAQSYVHTQNISLYKEHSDVQSWIHNVPINMPSAATKYTLKVWVSDVNGMADDNPCNDTLVEYLTGINGNASPRKLLLERFTGTWCSLCPKASVIQEDLINQYNNIIPVEIHDRDAMAFPDGLRQAFSVNSFPTGMLDRTRDKGYHFKEYLPFGFWEYEVPDLVSAFAPASLSIDHQWNPTTRQLTATVTADYSDHSAGEVRLLLMVVEDSLVGQGVGWDQYNSSNTTVGHPYYGAGNPIQGYVHRHVLRDYVQSGPFGVAGIIPTQVQAGAQYQHNFQYTVPASYNADQIKLIASLVRVPKGNDPMYESVRGQREVINSTSTSLKTLTNVVMLSPQEEGLLAYPNPTSDELQVVIENYSGPCTTRVFNAAGQLLTTTTAATVSLKDYPTGVYLLQVQYERKIGYLKVMKK